MFHLNYYLYNNNFVGYQASQLILNDQGINPTNTWKTAMEITLDTDVNNTPQLFLGSLNISNEINNRYTKEQIDTFLGLKLNSSPTGDLIINTPTGFKQYLNINNISQLEISNTGLKLTNGLNVNSLDISNIVNLISASTMNIKALTSLIFFYK